MQNLQDLLQDQQTSTESKSTDTRQFAEKQVDWFNADKGRLNEVDGIDCPKCNNKGKIAFAKKIYEDCDRKEMYVTECECMKQRKTVRYAKQSGMGELLNITSADYIVKEPWQKEAKDLALSFLKDEEKHWFALLGQTGAGKTLLCSAVANCLLKLGVEVRYCVWGLITKDLKQDTFAATGTRELLPELQRVPVLYIDDLFKGKVGEQDVSLMFDLLNYRYNAKLTTLITSELMIGELADIDTAIAGRIRERCGKYLFQATGEEKNYRFKQEE